MKEGEKQGENSSMNLFKALFTKTICEFCHKKMSLYCKIGLSDNAWKSMCDDCLDKFIHLTEPKKVFDFSEKVR